MCPRENDLRKTWKTANLPKGQWTWIKVLVFRLTCEVTFTLQLSSMRSSLCLVAICSLVSPAWTHAHCDPPHTHTHAHTHTPPSPHTSTPQGPIGGVQMGDVTTERHLISITHPPPHPPTLLKAVLLYWGSSPSQDLFSQYAFNRTLLASNLAQLLHPIIES